MEIEKAFVYLVRSMCSLVKGPALSLLMLMVVISLVRYPPGRLGQRGPRTFTSDNEPLP